MCFIVHWDRACTVCGMEDVFSQEVVHCPTIKDLGLADGMMDCVAKNEIVSANAAPYVCDDCFEDEKSQKMRSSRAKRQSWPGLGGS